MSDDGTVLQPARPWRAVDGLEAALRLFEDPACWVPDSARCFARDAQGEAVPAIAAVAVRFSWRGAVFRVAATMERRRQVFEALDRANPLLAAVPKANVKDWSHAEIVQAFRAAIRLAKGI